MVVQSHLSMVFLHIHWSFRVFQCFRRVFVRRPTRCLPCFSCHVDECSKVLVMFASEFEICKKFHISVHSVPWLFCNLYDNELYARMRNHDWMRCLHISRPGNGLNHFHIKSMTEKPLTVVLHCYRDACSPLPGFQSPLVCDNFSI